GTATPRSTRVAARPSGCRIPCHAKTRRWEPACKLRRVPRIRPDRGPRRRARIGDTSLPFARWRWDTIRMAGEIAHYEISASDVDRAQRFWSGLFGWEFGPSAMPEVDYRMARTGEESGAALTPGEPGHPNVYFSVDDIEAAIATVRELGGNAEEKQPVPTMGWFTACKDSEGNEFSLWQTDSSAG